MTRSDANMSAVASGGGGNSVESYCRAAGTELSALGVTAPLCGNGAQKGGVGAAASTAKRKPPSARRRSVALPKPPMSEARHPLAGHPLYSWLYPELQSAPSETPEAGAGEAGAPEAAVPPRAVPKPRQPQQKPGRSRAAASTGRDYLEVRVNEDERGEDDDDDGDDDDEDGDGRGRGGRRRPAVRAAWAYLKKAWMGAIHRSGWHIGSHSFTSISKAQSNLGPFSFLPLSRSHAPDVGSERARADALLWDSLSPPREMSFFT